MTGLVLDTSAAIAVLTAEPAAPRLLDAIEAADERVVGAATLVELGIVLEARLGPAGRGVTQRFVRDGGFDTLPFDAEQADVAVDGWRRFGRGRHPAALNLGDCLTYAVAIVAGLPILCVGDDFRQTDAAVVPLTPTH